uniref:Sigma factor n=1 Tax=Monsonia marlothii TaxID=163685 RepID=A0A0G2SY87_9ROSI|nr:sigma factor [Monsonia marlothii]
MAIATVCSSSPNCSPTLPKISPPSLKIHHHNHQPLPSTSGFDLNLVSNDALTTAPAAQTVALAGAALEAAMLGEVNYERETNGIDGLAARRKKRRERRKGLEDKGYEEVPLLPPVTPRSRHLTRKQEEQFCMCLKEGARLEAERRKLVAALKHEPSLEQLARVMGMKKRSIDNILYNTTESEERLIRAYRGLIVSVAVGYQGKGLSLQDLVQVGSVGLLRGAEKFDPKRGYKLSTYAYWWIRQAITIAVAIESRPFRLPGSACSLLVKIIEAKNILSSRLRRLPSHYEIAELLDVQVSRVKLICRKSRPPSSLDRAIVTDRGSVKIQDIIAVPDELTPEQIVRDQQIKEEVERLLGTLSKRESDILRLRYGLDGHPPKSYKEIGDILNLSRERIRQISIEALTKLQQTSSVNNLKLLYGV